MIFLFILFSQTCWAFGQDKSAGKKQLVDFQGDPLPADAISRLGSARLQGARTRDVAFSPDGKVIAAAGYNHAVHIWDAATGKELRLFTSDDRDKPFSQSRWLHCVAFSPDGKYLTCGEHHPAWAANTVRIWDFATGMLLHTLNGSKGGTLAVAFSPDNSVLATAGFDASIVLWTAATGQQIRTLEGHVGAVRSVSFNAKGDLLASASDDRTIRLWDPATGKELRRLSGHVAEVASVRFSPDGQRLVSASLDQTVRLWNAGTEKEDFTLRRHTDAVLRVEFAPDGKTFASAGKDRTIFIWDALTGKKMGALEGSQKDVLGLSFSPKSQMLASCTVDRVFLWDLKTSKELHREPGHQATVRGLLFLPGDSNLLSVGLDGTVRWWQWRKGEMVRQVSWHKMPDWRSFKGFENPLIALSAKRIALAATDGSIHLLDAVSGKEIGRLEHDKGPTVALTFSPDGKTLASSHGTVAQLWDVVAQKVIRVLPADPVSVKYLCFAPDGKLLLAGKSTSRLWDVSGNKLNGLLPLAFESSRSVGFTPDGQILAYGDISGNLRQWDVTQGQQLKTLTGLKGYVAALAVSPDGRLLAAAGWRSIKIWEISSGLERRTFQGFEENSMSLAFSADGRHLASATGDNNVLIWDVPGQALADALKADASPKTLQNLWQDLASDNGMHVHRGIWGLVGRQSDSVPYLRSLLKPSPKPDAGQLARLLKDLDADSFSVREKATKKLQAVGEMAEVALQKLIADPPSLEAKLRAKMILDQLTATSVPKRLQPVRAIEALEHMTSPEAMQLLEEISKEAYGARLASEAERALKRLKEKTD